ncbi:hypothetical protein [Leptolyngbya sp. PCC 6406]|uniref:hypothetical protein n=1 Tax=Leptolyngbya sp. PCC 6406 TaxID=1173264 RepID=UPI0002ABE5D1|nr:hypothetical protein [Leptolyngbya sp. PCC 6406]
MRLWLLCCGVIFAGAQGYDWLSHQGWFTHPDLGLPWLVLGGLGLAIASNYRQAKAQMQPISADPQMLVDRAGKRENLTASSLQSSSSPNSEGV